MESKFKMFLMISGFAAGVVVTDVQAQTEEAPPVADESSADDSSDMAAPAVEETPAEAVPESESPAATESPVATVTEQPKDAVDTAHYGLLGPLRIGPTVSIGFPFLLNYSLDATWNKKMGFSVSGGRMHRELTKDTEIELFNWDVRARWFPFQGSFFLGAAYGNQGIVAKTKKDLKVKASEVELNVPTTMRLELNTNYVTPHLGWFATWNTGFSIGTEIGYQIPLSSKAELQTGFEDVSSDAETAVKNSDEYKKSKKDLESSAEAFGKKAVPYLNLFRIGWLF